MEERHFKSGDTRNHEIGTSVLPSKLELIGDENMSAIMSIVCTYVHMDCDMPHNRAPYGFLASGWGAPT